CRLLAADAYDALAFLRGEARELTGRPIWVQPMHAVCDQPVNVSAKLRLVDGTAAIERHHVGREDAGEFIAHKSNSVDYCSEPHTLQGPGPSDRVVLIHSNGCFVCIANEAAAPVGISGSQSDGNGFILGEQLYFRFGILQIE